MKPTHYQVKNNQAYLFETSLAQLAKDYQTPLYVYDEEEIQEKLATYRTNFSSSKFQTQIIYACKAFLVPALLDLLKSESCGMDSVSLGDLAIAQHYHFPMEHIVFHGNNKTDEELEFALDHNVGLIVVDNLDELIRLNQIASIKNKMVSTLFRMNPGVDSHTHRYIQTALNASKFGESIYDEEQIEKIMNVYKASQNVRLCGFHSHIGSQIHELAPFLLQTRKMAEFSHQIEKTYGIELPYFNLGGGIAINYEENEPKMDYANLLKEWIKEIEIIFDGTMYHPKKVFLEPGRSIVGEAGLTLYTVGETKKTYGGKNYLFVDGGMCDNIRPALYNARYHAVVCNHVEDKQTLKVDVAGKCCESGDILIHDEILPVTKPKDILAIFSTGAYNYDMFVEYNSILRPAVVFVSSKKVQVVSRRQTLDDLIHRF
jgi:diaminopimelate decarboxylase